MQEDATTGDCVYHYVRPQDAKNTKLMDYHEKIVYKILQQVDDMGCTIGELRQKVLS